jgi:hypothetical protein
MEDALIYQSDDLFQRTDKGRLEIRLKKQGLTQSERLMLIMVDGLSNYGALRMKLKSLKEERFDRALLSLLDRGLIVELSAPLEDHIPEIIDNQEMDNFLRQEDLDPVSVIAYSPEEEFGVKNDVQSLLNSVVPFGPSSVKTLAPTQALPEYHPFMQDEADEHRAGDSVDFYLPLAVGMKKSNTQELRKPAPPKLADELEQRLTQKRALDRNMKMAYSLVGLGVLLLLVYLFVRVHGA